MPAPDKTADLLDEVLDPDTNAVEKADVAVSVAASRWRHTAAVKAAGALSEVADQPPALTLGLGVAGLGIVAGDRRLAEAGLRLLAAVALATAAKSSIKAAIARTRPNKMLDDGHYEVKALGPNEGPWNSFPSGHTADAVAMARAVVRVYPGLAAPAYAGAVAMGAIQVLRGAHYPIDVAAGALVGWAAEAAVDGLARALIPDVVD